MSRFEKHKRPALAKGQIGRNTHYNNFEGIQRFGILSEVKDLG